MSHFFRELETGMAREFGRSVAALAVFVVGCVLIVTGGILALVLWIGYLASSQPVPADPPALVSPEVENEPTAQPAGSKDAPRAADDKLAREKAADARLTFARAVLSDPARRAVAIRRLEAIVKDFPETRAATEAGELLARNR